MDAIEYLKTRTRMTNNSIIYCNESELEIYKNILSDNSYYEYI